MFTRSDHFPDASQASLQAQLAFSVAAGRKALESAQRFADLNVGFAKASMRDADAMAHQLLAARSAREGLAIAVMQAQPLSRKAVAYACHAAGIAAGTQSDFIEQFATQATATGRDATQLVADVSRNAPPGLNRMLTLMRVTFDNVNAGLEQAALAGRQVTDALKSNLIAAGNQFARA
jgi:phasin family protein